MTDAATTPLTIVGDPNAAVCEGDFCEIPQHHEAAIINRRVDADEI
jgi:hypothetical protein